MLELKTKVKESGKLVGCLISPLPSFQVEMKVTRSLIFKRYLKQPTVKPNTERHSISLPRQL